MSLFSVEISKKIKAMGAVMGSAMKSTMDENFKKNQEFMLQTQKLQVQSL